MGSVLRPASGRSRLKQTRDSRCINKEEAVESQDGVKHTSVYQFLFQKTRIRDTSSKQWFFILHRPPVAFSHIRKVVVADIVVGQQEWPLSQTPSFSSPPHSNLCLVSWHSNTPTARNKHVRGVCNPSKRSVRVISIAMLAVLRYLAICVPLFANIRLSRDGEENH